MNFHPRKRRMPQVIIVSLIDIFAILLIFVIVTTTFKTAQPQVTIKLPESKSAVSNEKAPELGVLSISEKEEIFLDANPVALEDLARAVAQRLTDKPKQGLAMRADERVTYGFLIKVLDALKEAGVKGNLSAFTDRKR